MVVFVAEEEEKASWEIGRVTSFQKKQGNPRDTERRLTHLLGNWRSLTEKVRVHHQQDKAHQRTLVAGSFQHWLFLWGPVRSVSLV